MGIGRSTNPQRVIMWFGRRKNGITEEIVLRIANVEAKVEQQKQLVDNLRGIVNRKLGNTAGKDGSDNNINEDGLDELRSLNVISNKVGK